MYDCLGIVFNYTASHSEHLFSFVCVFSAFDVLLSSFVYYFCSMYGNCLHAQLLLFAVVIVIIVIIAIIVLLILLLIRSVTCGWPKFQLILPARLMSLCAPVKGDFHCPGKICVRWGCGKFMSWVPFVRPLNLAKPCMQIICNISRIILTYPRQHCFVISEPGILHNFVCVAWHSTWSCAAVAVAVPIKSTRFSVPKGGGSSKLQQTFMLWQQLKWYTENVVFAYG